MQLIPTCVHKAVNISCAHSWNYLSVVFLTFHVDSYSCRSAYQKTYMYTSLVPKHIVGLEIHYCKKSCTHILLEIIILLWQII